MWTFVVASGTTAIRRAGYVKIHLQRARSRPPHQRQASAASAALIWAVETKRKAVNLLLPTPQLQGISQAALRVGDSGGLLVVVINGLMLQCLHKLCMQWSTRRSTRDPFALCSRSKKKRPLLATRHMHAGPPYKRRKQELTTRSGKSSFAMTSPGICLLSVAIHVCTFAFSQR